MKALRIIALLAALSFATSCGVIKTAGAIGTIATIGSKVANSDAGKNVGQALSALFTQFKKLGKIDLSNAANIFNIGQIASNIGALKTTTDTSAFVEGLIAGSENLVNQKNSNKVMETLTSLADLNTKKIAKANEFTAPQNEDVLETISTLTTLFKTLK